MRRDLLVGDQDVGIFQLGFHALGVGDEVGRDVAAVDLHPLGVLRLEGDTLALLDRDHAVLADLLHHLGDQVANLAVGGRDGGDVRDVGAVAHRLGQALQLGHQRLGALIQAALEQHRVGAGGDDLQTLGDDRLGQHGGGGGAVAGDIVGLGGDLDQQPRAHVLKRVFELDLLGDGHAVVGDGRGTELLVDRDIAPARAERGLDRIGDDIDAALERAPGLFVEQNLLWP